MQGKWRLSCPCPRAQLLGPRWPALEEEPLAAASAVAAAVVAVAAAVAGASAAAAPVFSLCQLVAIQKPKVVVRIFYFNKRIRNIFLNTDRC